MPTAILRTVIETQSAAAEAQLGRYGKLVNSTSTQASKGLMGLGTVGTVAFAAVAAGAVAFGVASVKAYSEHQKALTALQASLRIMPKLAGENTKAFEDQATALQRLTGTSRDEILAADTVLTRFGLTRAQIQSTIPVVLDYARATGVDATQAAINMGKGTLGMTRALLSVGIKLTAAEKATMTFSKMIDLMRGKVGGAAAAFGQTFAGKVAILSGEFKIFEEEVGAKVVPVLGFLMHALEGVFKVLGLIAKGWGFIVSSIGPFVTSVQQVNTAGETTKDLFANIDWGTPAIQAMTFAVQTGKASLTDLITTVKNSNMSQTWKDEALAEIGAVQATDKAKTAYHGYANAADAAAAATQAEKVAAQQAASALASMTTTVQGGTTAFDNLATKGKITAGKIVTAFNNLVTDMNNWAVNSATAIRRGMSPAELQAFIRQTGTNAPAALAALAGSSKHNFNKVKGDIDSASSLAQTAARTINGLNINLRVNTGPAISALQYLLSWEAVVTQPRSETIYVHQVTRAKGGVFPGFAAGVVTKPTLMNFAGGTALTGEGRYSTRFGRGAEGVLPLTDTMFKRLGSAIAEAMGGGGRTGIVQNIQTIGPPELVADLVIRKLQAASR